ncbi:hypothetical protein IMG5_007610 [Ichthyophthirius multifiliis]|uniref:Uncharacterized protein n=1 Tax=Ichthyophthirius multifiliis TaxID=5932 RepID=G0QJQ1_ICHMU|nr:hypothetical protein IMG5_007610 [Ichthyophthirius multifiliis]EGR34549.1 hypothetical protein IMG5_007610 [Ichthyophthirius multifiliis]|eukprot:XP_004039853.1 hypothetical protein IMG5_007610 [Ichthyophthirius multifiliis]
MIENFKWKNNLDILIEKPLIKIKQLDPKIIEKGKELNQYIEKSKLKKKIRKSEKRIIKDIKSDQAVYDKKKLDDNKVQQEQKKAARKIFNQIMDEQAKEVKRIKTTQINFKRNKKKGRRMAGNRVSD